MVPLAAEFLATHAKVDLRLVLSDRPLNLIDEHLDLALRIGELPDSSLVAVRVGSVRSVICASPGYLAKRGVPKTPAALATHDCVTFSALGGEGWPFPEGEVVRVHSRLAVSTAEAALDAAICGAGITRLLSYQVSAAVKAEQLTLLLRKYEPAALPVSLIYVRERRSSGKLRAFLDFAASRLRAAFRPRLCETRSWNLNVAGRRSAHRDAIFRPRQRATLQGEHGTDAGTAVLFGGTLETMSFVKGAVPGKVIVGGQP